MRSALLALCALSIGCAARRPPPSMEQEVAELLIGSQPGQQARCNWTLDLRPAEPAVDLRCEGLPANDWVLWDLPALAYRDLLARVRGGEGQAGGVSAIAGVQFHDRRWKDAPPRGPATWAGRADARGVARLRYVLRMDGLQAAVGDAFASFALPYREADHAFLRGNFAFVTPRVGAVSPSVTVSLPEGWTFASPWPEVGGVSRPADLRSLLDNYALAGDVQLVEGTAGELTYRVASVAPLREGLLPALQAGLESAAGLLPPPPGGTYLWVVRPKLPRDELDGMAGANSGQVALSDTPGRAGVVAALDTMLHEYVHTWLPGRMDAGPAAPWLTEGFTVWLTLRLLVMSGALSVEEGESASFGLRLAAEAPGVSLAECRRQVPEQRAYAYRGGAMLASRLEELLGPRFGAFLVQVVEGHREPRDPEAFVDLVRAELGEQAAQEVRALLMEVRQGLPGGAISAAPLTREPPAPR